MMLLSRFWYIVLGVLLGFALYLSFLAVGQYNRRNAVGMIESLASDSQTVGWALQIDARRRLDLLLIGSSDQSLASAVSAANGRDKVPTKARDDARKALTGIKEKIPAEYRGDAYFAVDRDGRVVAQLGYDAANAFEDFELGGYPAIFDALHGFLRDDTWVWGGKIYRVVARPIEEQDRPIGAIVAIRAIDTAFASDIMRRTRANIVFFALGQKIASAAFDRPGGEPFDETLFDRVINEVEAIANDPAAEKAYRDSGRSEARLLGPEESSGVILARMPGDAWELGAGFAVLRQKPTIAGPLAFLSQADDTDKKGVNWLVIGLAILVGSLLGIVLSFFEHTLPLRTMADQGQKLRLGQIETLQVSRFRGGYRKIAQDINAGIDRIVERGGGVRKPADLESILGPAPAQPAMSAFAFPQGPPGARPSAPSYPQMLPNTGSNPALASGSNPALAQSNAAGSAAGPKAPPVPPPAPGSRPSGAPGPSPGGRPAPPGPNTATGSGGFPSPSVPPPGPAVSNNVPTPIAAPVPHALHAMASQSPAAGAPARSSASGGAVSGESGQLASLLAGSGEEDEATVVGQVPADVIAAAGGEEEWLQVYDDFIRTKKQCGEPVEGLTFEKFAHTLRKNRDQLIQRHHCKRVKFSVYVKEGRASLKATPVRE